VNKSKGFVDGFLAGGIWLLFFALLVPAGVVGWAIGHKEHRTVTRTVTVDQNGVQQNVELAAIAAAPAFSSDDLVAEPTDAWITNGGSTMNERYSPLDQIDTSNVDQLKGVWRVHLRGSATAAKYSAESQPIVYKGTLSIPTGRDDVFAIDVETGQIRWEYQAHLDQKISTVCCGWLSRGVALGDGKVFLGQLDGKLVALDQQTGKVAWSTQVAPWQDGYTITNARLYWDGRVYTGLSGGEFGIRGHVTAFDEQRRPRPHVDPVRCQPRPCRRPGDERRGAGCPPSKTR
jgi:glucose dehydrogenase